MLSFILPSSSFSPCLPRPVFSVCCLPSSFLSLMFCCPFNSLLASVVSFILRLFLFPSLVVFAFSIHTRSCSAALLPLLSFPRDICFTVSFRLFLVPSSSFFHPLSFYLHGLSNPALFTFSLGAMSPTDAVRYTPRHLPLPSPHSTDGHRGITAMT